MKSTAWFAMPLALSVLAGCATSVEDVHHYSTRQLGNSLTLVTSSTQIIITNPDGTVCVGPPPDATADLGFAAEVSVFSGGTDGGGFGEEEIPLGGRNANVLVTRDILFQSCLAEARLKLNDEERKAHYRATLDLLEKINAQTLDGASRGQASQAGVENVEAPEE